MAIDSNIVIAKDLPLISVLMLLLQKSLPWYQYWYCYCKRPSGGIDIDIAIAKHPLLVSILILLLHNTLLCYRYQYCYCILPVTGVAIVIAIDKWSANYRVSNNIKKIIIAQPCQEHIVSSVFQPLFQKYFLSIFNVSICQISTNQILKCKFRKLFTAMKNFLKL